jgi:two-component system LytT family response regulator
MKVLICDDNSIDIENIKRAIKLSKKKSIIELYITCFSRGYNVINCEEKFDLAFVDIEMPGVNGLSVTQHLKRINPNIIVFIVTSYQSYLDKAMDLNVFRYISKPIELKRFQESLNTAIDLYHQSTENIVLEYYDECYNIFTTDILYLTIEKRKTKVITTEREYITRDKFDIWKKRMLKYDYFAQTHYSFIVNLKNVIKFDKNQATLIQKSKTINVPISRAYYSSFKKSFYEYMGVTL